MEPVGRIHLMKLIDTHCHLYNKEFDRDREEMIQRADIEGVERFYLPMVDSGSRAALLELEARHPGKCIGMTGLASHFSEGGLCCGTPVR